MTAKASVRTTNIAGHRPRRRSRSATSERPMYLSATGMTTMAPSAEDAADREEERYRVQLHEASLLLLAVHDVQGVEERLHRRVGTPEGTDCAGGSKNA
jgi:hypothetical protein